MAHVLFVDDEARIRQVCVAALRDAGYDVSEACGGEEAIAWLTLHGAPDLMLLDIMMPRCDGMKVIMWLKAYHALDRMPVVVFAARGSNFDHEHKMLSMVCGNRADTWLWKPFKPEDAVAIVKRRLAGIKGQLPWGYQPPWLDASEPPNLADAE